MAIPKVMGIETEYGITVKNQPDFNPILSSLLLINSYETYRSSRVRWDYEAESPLRDARGLRVHGGEGGHVEGRVAPHQPDPLQRRALLRRPRPSRVLEPGDHQPARLRDLGPGRRADPEPVAPARGGGVAARAADPHLQEQHRQQGQLVRHPRELPDGPQGAVRAHRAVHDAVLRDAARSTRARARSAPRTTPSPATTRSPSAPTSSRPRSGWRRCTRGPSSTRATSRTPTPRSTAACTSSWATPTWRGLHLPEDGHHGHRAQHGRGRLHRPRPVDRRPGAAPSARCRATSPAARPSGSRTAARSAPSTSSASSST